MEALRLGGAAPPGVPFMICAHTITFSPLVIFLFSHNKFFVSIKILIRLSNLASINYTPIGSDSLASVCIANSANKLFNKKKQKKNKKKDLCTNYSKQDRFITKTQEVKMIRQVSISQLAELRESEKLDLSTYIMRNAKLPNKISSSQPPQNKQSHTK